MLASVGAHLAPAESHFEEALVLEKKVCRWARADDFGGSNSKLGKRSGKLKVLVAKGFRVGKK